MQISAETREFIRKHQNEDIRELALQASRYPGVDMQLAIDQIAGRRIAADKIPSWYASEDIIYPPHLSMEQCSSEATARYKSSLIQGDSLVDLTGGFGIDCSFLANNFKEVMYVERQSELCEIARHNFSVSGLNHIRVENAEAVDSLRNMPAVDCIYIDPARRDKHGGKTFLISDCEPDVSELEELLLQKAESVLIKLSPMLDISLAINDLSNVVEVHVVSVKNECKEILLLLKRDIPENNRKDEIPIHCLNLVNDDSQSLTFTRAQEADAVCCYANNVEDYLYEPNASIMKAGAFKYIAQLYGLQKLHPNSHLYTSASLIDDFTGRKFRITDYGTIKEKRLTEGLKKANIATRNFPLTAPELRKRLKLQEGGDVYFFGTTLNDNKRVIIKAEKC